MKLIKVHWEDIKKLSDISVFYKKNVELMEILREEQEHLKKKPSVDQMFWSSETQNAVKEKFFMSNKRLGRKFLERQWSWQMLGYGPSIDETVSFGYIKILGIEGDETK
jgi:hypothetical protein